VPSEPSPGCCHEYRENLPRSRREVTIADHRLDCLAFVTAFADAVELGCPRNRLKNTGLGYLASDYSFEPFGRLQTQIERRRELSESRRFEAELVSFDEPSIDQFGEQRPNPFAEVPEAVLVGRTPGADGVERRLEPVEDVVEIGDRPEGDFRNEVGGQVVGQT